MFTATRHVPDWPRGERNLDLFHVCKEAHTQPIFVVPLQVPPASNASPSACNNDKLYGP